MADTDGARGPAKVRSGALRGIEGIPVDVEVDIGSGLPAFNIVGLAEAEVREHRSELQQRERRLQQREEQLDHKVDQVENRDRALTAREDQIKVQSQSRESRQSRLATVASQDRGGDLFCV